jgi:hypothetical protein
MIFVCPKANIWWETFEHLREIWVKRGRVGEQPPIPLILAGWIYSSDRDKQERWSATLCWAEQHSLSNMIPELKPEDQYCTEFLSTSYPEQNYRLDRYVERERASNEMLIAALATLKRDWVKIAGDELGTVCEPVKFTGTKARRLLVIVTKNFQPSWGSWDSLSCGSEKENFTAFRRRVNDAISPAYVDHIDFEIRFSSET